MKTTADQRQYANCVLASAFDCKPAVEQVIKDVAEALIQTCDRIEALEAVVRVARDCDDYMIREALAKLDGREGET